MIDEDGVLGPRGVHCTDHGAENDGRPILEEMDGGKVIDILV
jgi:hypothetical protein